MEDRIDALSIRLNALTNHMNQMEEINNHVVDSVADSVSEYVPYERVTDSICDSEDFEDSEIDSIDCDENRDSNDVINDY